MAAITRSSTPVAPPPVAYFDPTHCPVCGSPLATGAPRCQGCTLQLDHPLVARLAATLHEADRTKAALVTDRAAFGVPVDRAGAATAAVAGRSAHPTRPRDVPRAGLAAAGRGRAVLLAVGALCVTAAGSVFAFVGWALLGRVGRAVVLLLLAGASIAGARALDRRRLVGSAETLGALAAALVMVAWRILVAEVDLPGEDAIGWAALGVAGAVAQLRTTRRWLAADAVTGLGTATALVIACVQLGDWQPVTLVALPVVAVVAAWRPRLVRATPLALTGAALGGVASVLVVIADALTASSWATTPTAALRDAWQLPAVAAALALAAVTTSRVPWPQDIRWLPAELDPTSPQPERAWPDHPGPDRTGPGEQRHDRTSAASCAAAAPTLLQAAAAAALAAWVVGAVRVLPAGLGPWTSLALAGCLAGGLTLRSRPAQEGAGAAPRVLATASVVLPATAVLAIPLLGALGDGLSRAVLSQAVGLTAGDLTGRGWHRPPRPGVAWTWPATVLVLVACRTLARRRRSSWIDGLGPVLAAGAVPWTAHQPGLTSATATAVGVTVAVAIVLVGAAAPQPRGRALWSLPWWATAVSTASPDLRLLAGVLAGATLVSLARAGTASAAARRTWAVLATACATGTAWSLLLDLRVSIPEAYSLSAAAALAPWVWRELVTSRVPSAPALPVLGIALGTSALVSLADLSSGRALAVVVVAVGLVVVGAARRTAAHLHVGATVLAVLALVRVAPWVGYLPPWLPLGAGGGVLLALGITWEARLEDLRHLRRRVAVLR
ncbi:SCO7613 C-terminal domain-containing membrane protein [Arsenicicoccus dermatophilus]|uniref:SCO7613 C-terminal domain-containing membrane protein n=1 Tax=Arsenicicoccus dermatophilus TaxID=1076331 RepID=UPI001F4D3469|nr:hypothetical protein [Arsenicicoccus dermatophilus]MCH8613075.1 hypothetical protein [Arsenicicoccus dermatophilus]